MKINIPLFLMFFLLIGLSENFGSSLCENNNANGLGILANNYPVAQTDPLSRSTGVYSEKSNTLYVVLNDTSILNNTSLFILKSSSGGSNWQLHTAIPGNWKVQKSKLIIGKNDSIFLFFQSDFKIYRWSFASNQVLPLNNYRYRDFDVVISKSGSLYIFLDSLENNNLPRYASTDGGYSWPIWGNVINIGAHPSVFMSASGDTITISYYRFVDSAPDTSANLLRLTTYREDSPGVIVNRIGYNVSEIPLPKREVKNVLIGKNLWIAYTIEDSSSKNLFCRFSSTGGRTFSTPFLIGNLPTRNEFWFDADYSTKQDSGIKLIYCSDSLVNGPPTNNSSKLLYTFSSVKSPLLFMAPELLSHFPPVYTLNNTTALISSFDTIGIIRCLWLGYENSLKKLFYCNLDNLTNVQNISEIVKNFTLSQNYPNPFNPITIINYTVPTSIEEGNENVKLIIYNTSGSEISILVNERQNAGSYSAIWDATNYPSGIYFYNLMAGENILTKKMVFIK